MTENEIKKLIEDRKADSRHTPVLKQLSPGSYCLHRSWGFGKVAGFDPMLGKFMLDFKGRPGHAMDVRYAAESLEPLPNDHILVRRVTELDALKKMAAEQPLDLMRVVLASYGGQASPDQVANALSPDIISATDWKKWWDGAKRLMKKDAHFGVPVKKTEFFVLRGKPLQPSEVAMQAFEKSLGLKEKVESAEQLLRVIETASDREALLTGVIKSLNHDIQGAMQRQPSLALEGIWIRDELAAVVGGQDPMTVQQIHEIVKSVRQLGELLENLPGNKTKRLMPHLQTIYPETWHETLRNLLVSSSVKLTGDIIDFLIDEGQSEVVRLFLERVVRDQSASSDMLLWIARNRNHQSLAKILDSVLTIRLLAAILQALQRDQFVVTRKKNQLLECLLTDPSLVTDLTIGADLEEVRDIARRLLMHPALGEMDRRSLLGRIIKQHPPIQALLTSTSSQKVQMPIVSWESLEFRKTEYDELISKKIPANAKDIGIARSHGDLRENFEFKAAKDMQKLLMSRRGELEIMLANARGTDFADAKTEAVSIGTVVTLSDLTENRNVRYCILGAWDSDVDRGIISYQTALAAALINKKVGEEADFEIGDIRHHVRVDKIERYVDLKAEIGPPSLPKATPAA